MKLLALFLLIAAIHVAFVFGAYGTGMFGLTRFLTYSVFMTLLLGVSPVMAGVSYYRVVMKGGWVASRSYVVIIAIVAAAVSLYTGMFLAINTYGS